MPVAVLDTDIVGWRFKSKKTNFNLFKKPLAAVAPTGFRVPKRERLKMINPVKIQLLYFPGCPNVEETREVIKKALKSLSLDRLLVEEVDIHAPGSPEKYRNWPSPSILVNGQDVEGQPETEAAACRIYPGGRAPRLEKIIEALKPIKNPRQLEKTSD